MKVSRKSWIYRITAQYYNPYEVDQISDICQLRRMFLNAIAFFAGMITVASIVVFWMVILPFYTIIGLIFNYSHLTPWQHEGLTVLYLELLVGTGVGIVALASRAMDYHKKHKKQKPQKPRSLERTMWDSWREKFCTPVEFVDDPNKE